MTFYISGPMTGYPKFNFPAFDAAERLLLERGHLVFSPAAHDRSLGITEDTQIEQIPAGLMSTLSSWDIQAVQACDALFMLKGWEKSTGGRAEHALGVWLGKQIYYEASLDG